ncbi:YDG domain-containing protein [Bifidobacterium eulemuris]|nr:YDG domain-containing protein [Bifidobacterium eulemuris]QOL32514.1 Ig-like domain-containing protein [Bifidobacterium eulemuris]
MLPTQAQAADASATKGAFTLSTTDEGGLLEGADADYTYENNTLTITTEKPVMVGMSDAAQETIDYTDANGDPQSVPNGTKTDRIVVNPGAGKTANVTFDGVAIDRSNNTRVAAVLVQSGSLSLTLKGDSVLKSGGYCAGLQSAGRSLSISGEDDGFLSATGGIFAAGVGGGVLADAPVSVVVSGGTVVATGGTAAAGIGGGAVAQAQASVDVVVSGGTLVATGDRGGAGVGGGDSAQASVDVVVSGGTVTATGGNDAAGVGGGYWAEAPVDVRVSGGRITAVAGSGVYVAIGDGASKGSGVPDAVVSITGGFFADKTVDPSSATEVYRQAPADGHVVYANDDKGSSSAYPLAVGRDPLSLRDSVVYDGSAVSVSDVVSMSEGAEKAGVKVSLRYRLVPVGAGGSAWTDEAPSAAGVYEVEASTSTVVSGKGSSRVQWAAVTKTGTFTIERKALTVTAKSFEVAYRADAPIYSAEASGWVDGEADSLSATLFEELAYDCEYAKGSPVRDGGYEVALKWKTDAPKELANYAVALKPGKVTVVKSASTVTADSYKGEDKESSFTYGDTITVKATVTATGNEPGAVVFAAPRGLSDGSGFGLSGLSDGAGSSGVSDSSSPGTAALYLGTEELTGDMTVTDNKDGSYSFALEYDTSRKGVPIEDGQSLTVKFSGNANVADCEKTVTVDLKAKPVAVTVSGDASKTYDGSTAVPAGHTLGIGLSGVLEDDDVSASAQYEFDSANAGSKTVMVSDIALSGDQSGWYALPSELPSPHTVTSGIAKRVLTASVTVSGRTYDGTTIAPVDTASFKNLADGESLKRGEDFTVSAVFDKADAGGRTARATVVLKDTAAASNYTFANGSAAVTVDAGKATVAPARLVVTAEDVEVAYGSVDPAYSATVSGWVNGEGSSLSDTLSKALAYECEYAAGSPVKDGGYAVTPKWKTDAPKELSNYAVEFVSGTVTVVRSAGVVEDGDIGAYDADGKPSSSFTYGEKIIVRATVKATGKRSESAGASLLSRLSGLAGLSDDPASGTAALYYDGTRLTGDAEAEDNGDGSYSVVLSYDTALRLMPAGTRVLTVRFSRDANLSDVEADVEVSLAKRVLKASVEGDVSKTYDGSTAVPDGHSLGIGLSDDVLTGDKVSASAAEYAFAEARAGTKGVNASGVALSDGWGDWYVLESTEATGMVASGIAKRALTVRAENVGVVYGAEPPAYSVVADGWADGEGGSLLSVLLAALDYDCGYVKGSPVIETGYAVVPKWADKAPDVLSNYAVSFESGTVTVSRAQGVLTLTPDADQSVVYGDAGFKLTAVSNSGGVVSFSSSDTGVATVDAQGNVSVVGAGEATITAVLAETQNHTGASASVSLTVSKSGDAFRLDTVAVGAVYGDSGFVLAPFASIGAGTISYASSNEAVATVDAAGRVSVTGAGEAVLTVSSEASVNFEAKSVEVVLSVLPRPVSVVWDAEATSATASDGVSVDSSVFEYAYDGAAHAPTASVSNLVAGDECVLTVSGVQSDAGSYTATVTGVSNANYTLEGAANLTQGFSITPAAFSYTVEDRTVKAGSTLADLAVAASGVGVTLPDGTVEAVPGVIAWYADAEHATPLDASHALRSADGSPVSLWWTFTPSADAANYTGTATGMATVSVEAVSTDAGVVVNPDGSASLPDDKGTVAPGGDKPVVVNPDGSITLPEGGTFTPNPDIAGGESGVEVVVPAGGTIRPDGTVVDKDGTSVWTPVIEEPENPDNPGDNPEDPGDSEKPGDNPENPGDGDNAGSDGDQNGGSDDKKDGGSDNKKSDGQSENLSESGIGVAAPLMAVIVLMSLGLGAVVLRRRV